MSMATVGELEILTECDGTDASETGIALPASLVISTLPETPTVPLTAAVMLSNAESEVASKDTVGVPETATGIALPKSLDTSTLPETETVPETAAEIFSRAARLVESSETVGEFDTVTAPVLQAVTFPFRAWTAARIDADAVFRASTRALRSSCLLSVARVSKAFRIVIRCRPQSKKLSHH